LQRAAVEAERLHIDRDALEAKVAKYSVETSLCSTTAAKAEQELVTNLQTRLKVTELDSYLILNGDGECCQLAACRLSIGSN